MAKKIIRLKLKCYDYRVLDQQVEKIVKSVVDSGATVIGPVPLPTHKEIFTVLRSPHVNKTSREQFERRTHQRLILIENANKGTLDVLNQFPVPSGMELDISNR
jgi:small subunit ribosomal protein S10